MANTTIPHTRNGREPAKISQFFTDPFVAAAFRRAEDDDSSMFAVPTPRPPVLVDGAARQLEDA
jgi:hypothetical protein